MKRQGVTSGLALILTIAVLIAFAPRADAAIYVKIDGVDGDATHEEHKKWITAISIGQNISREITMLTDKKTGVNLERKISGPKFGEIQIVKQMDISSIYLLELVATDTIGKEVKIHFVAPGSPGQTYLEIVLSEAVISSVSVASEGDRPLEIITLNFTRIQWKYIPLEANNEAGSPVAKGYDLLLNAPF